MDTGASRSYIKPLPGLKGIKQVHNPFVVKSIHGVTPIKQKCTLKIFGVVAEFFLLPNLASFDGVIGMDLLNKVHASIDLKTNVITYDFGTETILFVSSKDISHLQLQAKNVPQNLEETFSKLIGSINGVFADPNEALPYNTNVVATIRTTSEDPVYSRLYPYPLGVSDFVNKEIQELLANGIIRPSRSPYNNPIWVVKKKGLDENGQEKKRLVMDFRKLNEKTISDKYPIPDISGILSNLGGSKFFTTLDLKSGFHQINLSEKDREKTAFSVKNGKYEFCRLPFGLKNAPSIFQRAIDDVLREHIGSKCFVYMDDVIVFSKDEEQHLKDIEAILRSLFEANMRVSAEKSRFFKAEVEFLGFLVTQDGIKTCPDKVDAIRNFQEPTTLRGLRSFLGLAGYYRCFIKDFAKIAKPLSGIMRGENGRVTASQSKKIKIDLTEEQKKAFTTLKEVLASEEVTLTYPDFGKPFELTTDASSYAIGAVLSQEGKPITMISRTLASSEEHFATNERELLAIVWALKTLRNYLYGVTNLTVHTDHQPLTFAVSDRNPNSKIKRWKAFINECNAKLVYKPGKENVVADALSRQHMNALDNMSTETIHSELSSTNTIEKTEKPVNCYRNQIVIEEGIEPGKRTFIVFGKKTRHLIIFKNKEDLIILLQEAVKADVVNAIYCDLHILALFQDELVGLFPTTKFRHTEKYVNDISDPNEQEEIIAAEHNRAHRAAQENTKQILEDYFFPKMEKKAKQFAANCRTCSKAKYSRHPQKQLIAQTPIPTYCGEILHIDIFSTGSKYFLTCIDKFSKFAIVQTLRSRTIVDVKPQLLQILNMFSGTKTVYCDNEKSLNSHSIKSTIKNHFNIDIANAPPLHSTSNGQVERFHSTLMEISRCLKLDTNMDDIEEIILLAAIKYNRSIHTVTAMKPITIFRPEKEDKRIISCIKNAQDKELRTRNKNRQDREFEIGEKVLVKNNRRLGNKLTPLYTEEEIEKDLGTTVLIRGRRVHKDNLRGS